MEVLYRRCAGLDVHKDTVVACVRSCRTARSIVRLRTFKTVTRELLALSEWLAGHGCTPHRDGGDRHLLEAGLVHILGDGEFELLLANAAHVKNVPGRKTDVNDATWLAGTCWPMAFVRGSFVPDDQTQELRGLLRTRKQKVRERARNTLRLQKTLEEANIKLDSVISDIVGLSGRRHDRGAGGRRERPDQWRAAAGPSAISRPRRRSSCDALARAGHQASSLPARPPPPADRRHR